jgi:hypothetical protein
VWCEHNIAPAAAQKGGIGFALVFGTGQLRIRTTLKAVAPLGGRASFFAWRREIGSARQTAATMPERGYRQPPTLRAAVFTIALPINQGAITTDTNQIRVHRCSSVVGLR